MVEITDREFVEWMRTETEGESRSKPNIGRLKSLSGVSDLVHFQPIISMVHIAILRLDLAVARAQIAALTAERDAAKQDMERAVHAIDIVLEVGNEILKRRVLGSGQDHRRWATAFLQLQAVRAPR